MSARRAAKRTQLGAWPPAQAGQAARGPRHSGRRRAARTSASRLTSRGVNVAHCQHIGDVGAIGNEGHVAGQRVRGSKQQRQRCKSPHPHLGTAVLASRQ